MKKLLLTAVALAFVATPAMAENALPGGLSMAPFGPMETHAHGIYPHDRFTAGDMDADSGAAVEHDAAASTRGQVALGDMDSDSSQFNNG